MDKKNPKEIVITGVLIQDEKSGGYTSYFREFPEAIAEGDSREEAISNLFDALVTMLKFRKHEANEEDENEIDAKVFTETFQLSVTK